MPRNYIVEDLKIMVVLVWEITYFFYLKLIFIFKTIINIKSVYNEKFPVRKTSG